MRTFFKRSLAFSALTAAFYAWVSILPGSSGGLHNLFFAIMFAAVAYWFLSKVHRVLPPRRE